MNVPQFVVILGLAHPMHPRHRDIPTAPLSNRGANLIQCRSIVDFTDADTENIDAMR